MAGNGTGGRWTGAEITFVVPPCTVHEIRAAMADDSVLPDDLRSFLTAHLTAPDASPNAPEGAWAGGADRRPAVLAAWAARNAAALAPEIVHQAFGEALSAVGGNPGADAWTFGLGAAAVYTDYALLPHRLREFCRVLVTPRVARLLGVRAPDPLAFMTLGEDLARTCDRAVRAAVCAAWDAAPRGGWPARHTARLERPDIPARPASRGRRPSLAPCLGHGPIIDSLRTFDLSTHPLWNRATGLPRPGDVQQGELSDCWLLAVLAAFAHTAPERLTERIEQHADGRYTVHLDRPVDVGPLVHTSHPGMPRPTPYAAFDQAAWVAVVEKAVARRDPIPWYNLEGWLLETEPLCHPGTYDTIDASGLARFAMNLLGWRPAVTHRRQASPGVDAVRIATEGLDRERLVCAMIPKDGGGHAYAVLARTVGGFLLYDPTGGYLWMSDEEFTDNALNIHVSGPYQPSTGLPFVDRTSW